MILVLGTGGLLKLPEAGYSTTCVEPDAEDESDDESGR
jgi:hypothetical protein